MADNAAQDGTWQSKYRLFGNKVIADNLQILTVDDGTFPALLKTLSDPSDAVVTRDLLLLSQISLHSDDTYFTSFMVNLLKLFCTVGIRSCTEARASKIRVVSSPKTYGVLLIWINY